MTLPGGPANKLGNRYETWWTVSECVRILRGDTESIHIEPPGIKKAEFVVTAGLRRELHQVKRSHPNGKWSMAALAGGGLLQAIGRALANSNTWFVFVSGSVAPELSGLCDVANDAESVEEFEQDFLVAETRNNPFEKLRCCWACDVPTAIERLKRIKVRTIDEHELKDKVRWGVQALFLAESGNVVSSLQSIVEDSVHRTITREGLVRALAQRGYQLRCLSSPEHAGVAVEEATDRYLDSARRWLIQETLVRRKAPETLLFRLVVETRTDSVLTGKAGAGKTACVIEIVDGLRTRGWPVLAFRLDHVLSASTTADLGSRLELEESPILVLAAAAEAAGRPGVLIVDQLDAVSTVSDRNSAAFDLVERLLQEARGTSARAAIHVVVVCRTFDWKHDHRLRQLLPDSDAQVDVTEFTLDEVRTILAGAGFGPASFRGRQLELLRLPQNLYFFLKVGFDTSHTPDFSTAKALFDRYWDEKRRLVRDGTVPAPDQWLDVIQVLCDEMAGNQQLAVTKEKLDRFSSDFVDRMVSEGVLAFDGCYYEFGHESFFDYCFARLFVKRSESLAAFLKGSEQHLFRRAQVRQVLTYLRDADRVRYLRELAELLSDEEIRTHIKDLAFALLAEVSDPDEEEWKIWQKWTAPALKAIKDGVPNPDKPAAMAWWRFLGSSSWSAYADERDMVEEWLASGMAWWRFLGWKIWQRWIAPALRAIEAGVPNPNKLSEMAWRRFFRSPSWFAWIDERGMVRQWLVSANDRLADMATDYLRVHQRHSPDRIAALLEPYADRDGAWPQRLRTVMEWVDQHTSRRFFALFLRLVDNGTLDEARRPIAENSTFWNRLYGLDETHPEWVAEVLAHRLQRRFNILRDTGDRLDGSNLMDHDRSAARVISVSAECAPAEFVRHVLPVLLEISDAALTDDEPPKRDAVWPLFINTEHPGGEQACLAGLAVALAALAR